jgi:hypothetical protein
MKMIKSLWALLPMACLMLASCSSDEATESAQQKPENLKPVATIDIPITATAVVDGSKTRAEVSTDNKTLVFATGDSLWVTGKLSAESANDGDTNYPYTLNGWLSLGASGNAYQDPDFVGTLKYTTYEYSDLSDGKDWPGLGDNNPVYSYDSNTTFTLHAVLKGLYQDKACWPGEVADVSQLTSLDFSSHPICVANGNSSALNEAVKKYSLLIGTTNDNGIRIPSELSRVMFRLEQKTVFLNFIITFSDGTLVGEGMNVTFANNGSTLGAGTVTTVSGGNGRAVANFVVPVAAGTVLNNATLSIAGYAPMSIGTNETLEAGTVYSINKAFYSVQLWEGGPYFATKNLGARSVTGDGLYFAWGEATGYSLSDGHYFDFMDRNSNPVYIHANGYSNAITKYCINSNWGDNGFTDGLTTLEAEDDAATAYLGSPWRIPTIDELNTLSNEDNSGRVTSTWVSNYNGSGVNGRLFTGTQPGYTDHSIFLPASGECIDAGRSSWGETAQYWSSSLYDGEGNYSCWAFYLFFYSGNVCESESRRDFGFSVRPVRDSE